MAIKTLRGFPAAKLFEQVGIVFAAYVPHDTREGHVSCHAMLRCLAPGESMYDPPEAQETPVELTHVYVDSKQRSRGIGGAMVRKCIRFADLKGWIIVLRAQPYLQRKTGIDLHQLHDWYRTFGFVCYHEGEDCHYMIRYPETRKV